MFQEAAAEFRKGLDLCGDAHGEKIWLANVYALAAKDIVLHRAVRPPASARPLLAVLDKKSPRNKSHVG